MPDAAGDLLRLAHYLETLPPEQWRPAPTALTRAARACLPYHADTARYLNLTSRQFATLNYTPAPAEAAQLLRGLAHARRKERRPVPLAVPPAGAPLPL